MSRHSQQTSGGWGSAVIETIKRRPIPLAMVGGGLTWLIACGLGRSDEEAGLEERRVEQRRKIIGTDETATYGLGFIDRRGRVAVDRRREQPEWKSTLRGRTEEAKQKAADLGEEWRSKASGAGEAVKEKAQKAGDAVAGYGRQARQKAVKTGRLAKGGFFTAIEDNPLAVASAALTAGLIVGLIIPESRYEKSKLGPARDRAVDRAREAGRDTVHKAKSVAREAVDAAKQEAAEQDLAGRDQTDWAERKVSSAAQKTMNKAREQASNMSSRTGPSSV